MEIQSLINSLEEEWDLDRGFLGKLRIGTLDTAGFSHLKATLSSVDFNNDALVDRRIVSLIWYIPLFMSWQRERFLEDDKEFQFLDTAINEVTSILEHVLGTP